MKRLIIALALLMPLPALADSFKVNIDIVMGPRNARVVHSHTDNSGTTNHTVVKDNIVYYCFQGLSNGEYFAGCFTKK